MTEMPSLPTAPKARQKRKPKADALRLGRCALLVLDEADKLLKDAACSADVAALREAMPPTFYQQVVVPFIWNKYQRKAALKKRVIEASLKVLPGPCPPPT